MEHGLDGLDTDFGMEWNTDFGMKWNGLDEEWNTD